ncbi:DUF4231 domain-containing protein [Kribbella sp. NPDC049174]|uniref:DUF4231 domain-containing protein n=1 Tax=Kribbella sp. NPDC049174 TaxID=3364112 RepID=UPI00371A0BB2
MAIPDTDMPQLFRAADQASRAGQRSYLRLTQLRLTFVVAAAACGVASWRMGDHDIDLLGLVALLLFIGALLVESQLWKQHPERDWYDGRAVAESAKTLSWKFAAAGDPFPRTMNNDEADRTFVSLLDTMRARYPQLSLDAIIGSNLTPWMRSARSANLDERKRIYIADRVQDQQKWYQDRHNQNRRKARFWRIGLIALEFGGAAAALLESLTDIGLTFTPTLAAAIGAIVAWLETKQHDQIARAYATTVSDLASALAKLEAATTEEDWAREMNDAEDAISREHTLWLASRSHAG